MATETSPELSILVPVFNEGANLPRVVAAVEAHIPQPFTLHVVYDFDEDDTVPVARELGKTRPWLRLLKNQVGRGFVNALRQGFQTVGSGPTLVVMGDLSDDLSVVPEMLALYRRGFRIVCPSRYMPGGSQEGGPMLKGLFSRVAGLSLYHLAGFPTRDATNNFRLYDAALVNELGVLSKGGPTIALELTARAARRGEKVTELPGAWKDRTAGASHFQLKKVLPGYLRWYAYALTGR